MDTDLYGCLFVPIHEVLQVCTNALPLPLTFKGIPSVLPRLSEPFPQLGQGTLLQVFRDLIN